MAASGWELSLSESLFGQRKEGGSAFPGKDELSFKRSDFDNGGGVASCAKGWWAMQSERGAAGRGVLARDLNNKRVASSLIMRMWKERVVGNLDKSRMKEPCS